MMEPNRLSPCSRKSSNGGNGHCSTGSGVAVVVNSSLKHAFATATAASGNSNGTNNNIKDDNENHHNFDFDDGDDINLLATHYQSNDDCGYYDDHSESQSESLEIIICAYPNNPNMSCTSSITNSFHSLMSSYSLSGSSRRQSMGFSCSRRSSLTTGGMSIDEGGSFFNNYSSNYANQYSRRSSLTNSIMEEASVCNNNNNNHQSTNFDDDQSQSEALDFESDINANYAKLGTGGANIMAKFVDLPITDVNFTTSPKRKLGQCRKPVSQTSRMNYLPNGVFNNASMHSNASTYSSISSESTSFSNGRDGSGGTGTRAVTGLVRPSRRASVGCNVTPQSPTITGNNLHYNLKQNVDGVEGDDTSTVSSSGSRKLHKKHQRISKRGSIGFLPTSSTRDNLMYHQPYRRDGNRKQTSALEISVHSQSTNSTIPQEQRIEIKRLLEEQEFVAAERASKTENPVTATDVVVETATTLPTDDEGKPPRRESKDTMISAATSAATSGVRYSRSSTTSSARFSSTSNTKRGGRRYDRTSSVNDFTIHTNASLRWKEQQGQVEDCEDNSTPNRRDSRTTLGSATSHDSAPRVPRRHLSPGRT